METNKTYPCKGCILIGNCSDFCEDAKQIEINIRQVNYTINRRCPYCGSELFKETSWEYMCKECLYIY